MHRQVGPLREVLPEQTIGVFIGTSRARTEVRNSVKAFSYSCNAATSALSITVLLKPMPRVGGGILATFKTQHEAIDWARKQGHAPLVAHVRHWKCAACA